MKSKLLLLLLLGSGIVHAQKFVDGDKTLSFLKGADAVNLIYNYDDMLVGDEKEAAYKKRKIAEFNAKQKGKGERWADQWTNHRIMTYEPMFEELINKTLTKSGLNLYVARNQPKAKYTMTIKTLVTEPGFNAVVVKRNPYCSFDIVWTETETGAQVAHATLDKVQGVLMFEGGWDFDPSNNIKECYAKAGKMIGKTFAKNLR